MLNPGTTIDRYTVDSIIGSGGTAVVYLVRHNQLGSAHALKVLSLSSGAIRERLLREGRVQAALQHANIVTVTDVLDIGGSPGLLMEHIDGPALDTAMKRFKITLADALILFKGIVSGVRAAHRHGLVHRDLKPANVLLFRSAEGFIPKVTDFGLAKVLVGRGAELGQTRQGIAMGTPAYMAPEQVRDARSVDQRADIFSLGCILYELVTRARAFPGDQALEIYNNIVTGRYTPPEELVPDLPDAVIQAIDGCLVLDRELRIPDTDTLIEVLAGRRKWEAVPHPIPDEVMPTEEISRDAPDMPVAVRKATPPPIPRERDPAASGELADPLGADSEGTLGGEVSLVPGAGPPRLGWLIGGGLLLVLLLGLGVIGLGLGVGSLLRNRPAAVAVSATPIDPPELGQVIVDQPPDVVPAPVRPSVPEPAAVQPKPSSPPPSAAVDDDPPQPTATTAAPAPAIVEVKLLSVPRTVELHIDGVDHGRTPKKLELPAGTHRVRVRSGADEGEFTIRVSAGGANTWCYSFEEGSAVSGKCG
jgi:serine/threonine-protein kinase